MKRILFVLALLLCGTAAAEESSFYKDEKLFSTRPGETKSLSTIKRFGPVGMGIDLIQPAFVMRIANIEEGSPAAQTGKFKKGQVIEMINGQKLKDIDPRIQLGQILAQAEATDGKLSFKIKDVPDPVVVSVPVLGAYSETWPLNCPKSDNIVRQVADYIASPEGNKGLGQIGMLFLMSTGDDKDLEVVREWARTASSHKYPWYVGYGGIALTECYLRTGDKEILDRIQEWVDSAVSTQHLDAWAGRGSALTGYGSGHLNAAGTHVLTFLLLAKECGADVPDHTLHGALRHFYRYAGRGGNPYGDGRPEGGFVDNGKDGKLAFAMAAAASLTPDGENSLYAKARDLCANRSFYTTSFMLHGHTGGGIGEIWRSASMALMREKRPAQYRDFMDSRKWHYDLSRRFDGSFGILGGSGYDKEQWGVAYPLCYTLPRKNLRIMGAPPTKFSKPYQLPKQPWGTIEDNAFLSFNSVSDKNGRVADLSGETLANDSSMQFIRWFHGEKQPTDDEIRYYIYHPENNIRTIAAFKAVGINSGYIGWRKPGGEVRPHLVSEFLMHTDPRVRRAMFAAIHTTVTREGKAELLNDELFTLAVKSVTDKKESWWVKDAALQIIGLYPADRILPHVDLLLTYLTHEEDWLKNAALSALTPVAADDRAYKRVLPAIGALVQSNQRVSITLGLAPAIRAQLKAASPEAQALAREVLQEAFTGYAGTKTAEGGLKTTSTYDFHLDALAASLAEVSGGLDILYKIARDRHPDQILPYKELFLNADPGEFGPELRKVITPIINDELIPEFVGKNRINLRKLAAGEVQSNRPGGPRDVIDGLAGLNERAGKDEFGWHMFADLRNKEWSYHSFDPIAAEQVPYDQLITRYREVTMPKGMDNWYAADFDAGKVGWKTGKSPFGQYDGKVPTVPIMKCTDACKNGPLCFAATPINTLWENEVLLMRGTFKLPAIKDGHRYRMMVNDGNHVGPGGGYIIYVNGKPFIEKKSCNGRGSNGLPTGAFVTAEFLDDFKAGEVTIAIKTFIRYNDKYKVKPSSKISQGKISIHFDEQKLPPMGDDLVIQSASLVPMLSSDWQAKQDKNNPDIDPEVGKFRWDGKFVANDSVHGSWQAIGQVTEVNAFDPTLKRQPPARNAPFKTIVIQAKGRTDSSTWLWSGDVVMDLTKYQALKMEMKSVAGSDYLFVEAGGFSNRHQPGWKTPWVVYQRR